MASRTIRVNKPTQLTKLYETAAWFTTVRVPPGEYPIEEKYEGSRRYFVCQLPSTVIDSNCGATIGKAEAYPVWCLYEYELPRMVAHPDIEVIL